MWELDTESDWMVASGGVSFLSGALVAIRATKKATLGSFSECDSKLGFLFVSMKYKLTVNLQSEVLQYNWKLDKFKFWEI